MVFNHRATGAFDKVLKPVMSDAASHLADIVFKGKLAVNDVQCDLIVLAIKNILDQGSSNLKIDLGLIPYRNLEANVLKLRFRDPSSPENSKTMATITFKDGHVPNDQKIENLMRCFINPEDPKPSNTLTRTPA